MSATRADLMALQGTISFPELQIALNGLTLAQEQPSTIRVANGVAQVEQFTLSGSVGTITASGNVGLAGEPALETLDVLLEADADALRRDPVELAPGDAAHRFREGLPAARAEHLRPRPAEQPLGLRVDVGIAPFAIQRDEGVAAVLEHVRDVTAARREPAPGL